MQLICGCFMNIFIYYKMTNFSDLTKMIEELIETKRQLAELQQKLDKIEANKKARADKAKSKSKVSAEDKKFLEILNCALRRFEKQERKDIATINGILKKTIIQKQYAEYDFYTRFNKAVERLLNYETFVKECGALPSSSVAQHVVLHGDKAVNEVFKYGLIDTFGQDKIKLMSKAIFSADELRIEQYIHDNIFEPEDENISQVD